MKRINMCLRIAPLFFLGCTSLAVRDDQPQIKAVRTSRTELIGYIMQKGTGQPLSQLRVLLEGTTLSSVTGADGRFKITGVPTGMNKLILPRPGTAVFVKTLQIIEANENELVIEIPGPLSDDSNILNPTSQIKKLQQQIERLNRRNYYNRKNRLTQRASVLGREEIELFEKYIVGNSSKCRLVNPEALEFEKKERSAGFTLTFKSNEPLLIKNGELGYQLWVYLKRANLWKDRGRFNMKYEGETTFEELAAKDESEKKRWRRRRLKVYRGSYRHFLATLAAGRLAEEGFLIIDHTENNFSNGTGIPGARWSDATKIPLENPYALVSRVGSSRVSLDFPGALEIIYLFEHVDPEYLAFKTISEESQSSMLSLLEGPIVFSTEGNLFEDKQVAKTGYWSIEQISQLLPRDYIPN